MRDRLLLGPDAGDRQRLQSGLLVADVGQENCAATIVKSSVTLEPTHAAVVLSNFLISHIFSRQIFHTLVFSCYCEMMSQVQAMKKQVTQLRQEANVQRIHVSQACDE